MRDDTRLSGRKASVFTQDEWRPVAHVTLNFGLRYDDVQSVRRESRVSPRFNGVLSLADGVTLHAGYARYFLPAPLEDESDTPKAFAGTTAAPPTLRGEPLRAETDDYYDVGVEWKDDDLTLGLDGYWRSAKNFIAEGQFGPANLTASFNYSSARVRGIELTATYAEGPFTAWANLAVSQGRGRGIASNQFYFTAGELAAIAGRLTPLGQDQTYSASGGASYRWNGFRFIADAIYGSGLPFTRLGETPNAGHLGGYVQVNLAVRYTVSTGFNRPLDLRFDIINAFDSRYRLRDGSGLGDGPPQWGPRRGFFFGVEQSF